MKYAKDSTKKFLWFCGLLIAFIGSILGIIFCAYRNEQKLLDTILFIVSGLVFIISLIFFRFFNAFFNLFFENKEPQKIWHLVTCPACNNKFETWFYLNNDPYHLECPNCKALLGSQTYDTVYQRCVFLLHRTELINKES